jgi:diketogulonate reductase-like aldo/keto reductase
LGREYEWELMPLALDQKVGTIVWSGKLIPQIALNWLLSRPSVATILVGARNETQLIQNLGAIGWKLTAEQIAKLDAASRKDPIAPYSHQARFFERNPFPTDIGGARRLSKFGP